MVKRGALKVKNILVDVIMKFVRAEKYIYSWRCAMTGKKE